MKYEFDQLIDRRNTNSLKWNVKEDELAMWVADMDFQTAPCIREAVQKKAAFGIYGYSDIPEAYYTAYQSWWSRRYGFDMQREWMLFSSGVVPAVSSIIRRLTAPAEQVLILAPVYNIFYNSIRNNGRKVLTSNLVYENGDYHIDYADLKQKLAALQTTLMIICNPHNPIGKLWSREELAKINALCVKYHVTIVSDEIHCDLCAPGKAYIPFASVNGACRENSITCLSASKAFNLAGLQAACVVIANEALRHKVWRGLNNDEVAEPNVFACEAVTAAFQEGEEWLESLRRYLWANRKTAQHFLEKHIPQLHPVEAEATYLLWIDCTILHPFVDTLCDYLRAEQGLLVSKGSAYGTAGEDFIRMNIACPKEQLLEGLRRLKAGVEEFTQSYAAVC